MTAVDRIESLTDSQRAYLRLVLEHKSSKEIALLLGISAHTVDKRLKEAMRILGVSSRVEAARILAMRDSASVQPLGPQSQGLAILDTHGFHGSRTVGADDESSNIMGTAIAEERDSFRAYPVPRDFPLPFPTRLRPDNKLSITQRAGWTLGLIIALALATGMLLSGLSALSSVILTLAR